MLQQQDFDIPSGSQGGTGIELDGYCQKLEAFFGKKSEAELKKVAFKIFDITNNGQITEYDLSELLRLCVGLKENQLPPLVELPAQDQTVYALGETKRDSFMDIFYDDYLVIIKQIEQKK